MPNWHESFVATTSTRRVDTEDGNVRETCPQTHWPGDGLGNRLEFALKHDGVNLAVLAAVYAVVDRADLAYYLRGKPMGKYARRIWYLFELLTAETLPLSDINPKATPANKNRGDEMEA